MMLNVNMKFIKFFLWTSLILTFSCKRSANDISELRPEYKLIKSFSQNLKKETGLVLSGYGINIDSKPHNIKNGVANFSISYNLLKSRQDVITLEKARILLIYVAENFLLEINSNKIVRNNLDIFPFTSDEISICIHFMDENKIELGNGIASIYFSEGKIKYERYEIHEYRKQYPASGKHYTIHEESYKNAFDIVKEKNTFVQKNYPIPITAI